MKIKNINWEKIKKIPKTKLFAIGLVGIVGLVSLSGCFFDSFFSTNNNDNNSSIVQKIDYKNINITVNNSNYIDDYAIIYICDENKNLIDGTRIYNGEKDIITFQIKNKNFSIYSDQIGEVDIELPELQDLDIEIDYLEKTIKVSNEVSLSKIK